MTLLQTRPCLLNLLLSAVLAAGSPDPNMPLVGTTLAAQRGTVGNASTQAILSIPAGGLSADSATQLFEMR